MMGYPGQPPVPGYGPMGYPPMGYAAPPNPKMRKGPAIATGALGVLAGLVSLANLVLMVVKYGLADVQTKDWIVNGYQAIAAVLLTVLGGICFTRRRVVGWFLFGCAVFGLLRAPLIWIVYGTSPVKWFGNFFRYAVDNALLATYWFSFLLAAAVAVLALITALSREGPRGPRVPPLGQQYPPPGYPPYGRQY